jgi:hypothetical protein
MSATKSVGKAVMAPLIAAGASVATRYVVKKGPEFVEGTVLPWLHEATQAGGTAEKLQGTARSAVSTGGDLAGQLTERARDVTGIGGSDGGSGDNQSSRGFSQDELSRRGEERAKRRAQRRKTTKKK